MLVIKIELWPFGDETKKETIAASTIINDGTGTTKKGNYTAAFNSEKSEIVFTTTVTKHDRNKPVWELLWKCLNKQFRVTKGNKKNANR